MHEENSLTKNSHNKSSRFECCDWPKPQNKESLALKGAKLSAKFTAPEQSNQQSRKNIGTADFSQFSVSAERTSTSVLGETMKPHKAVF